jgi:L-arabinose isomerase
MKKDYTTYTMDMKDESGVYPDLLSEKIEPDKPKVGLLGFGWFEWWRQYPEQEQKTLDSLKKIENQLRACNEFELVYPGMVDTMDKADAAGRMFRDKQIDVLLIAEVVFIPDYFVVHAKRYVDDVYTVVYVSQREKNIPKDLNYRELMGDSSIIGSVQVTGAFAKMGWPCDVVVCPIGDPRLTERLARRCRVMHTKNWLKHTKLGVYAHPFRGMFDIEYDKTKLQAVIGPESIYVEERNVASALKNVKDKNLEELVTQSKKRFKLDPELKDSDLRDACRLALALEKIFVDYRLDAFSLLGQYTLELQANDNGGFASSLLLEKDHLVICEGDNSTISMMMLLKHLTGSPVYWGEFSAYDTDKNAFLFNHHGDGDLRLARSQDEIYLTYCAEDWGADALAFEFLLKPGTYTLASFIDDTDGFKFLIVRGEALDIPVFRIQTPQALIQIKHQINDFFETIIRSGFRHHAALCPGDNVDDLSLMADLMGVRKLILE